MHLANLFWRTVNMYGARAALATGQRPAITYAELGRRVNAIAYILRTKYGLEPGDRVCIAMKNCAEYAEAMWACWVAQLCIVPVNSKLHPKEIQYILEDSGSRVCLSQGEFLSALQQTVNDPAVNFVDVAASSWKGAAEAGQVLADDGLPEGDCAQGVAWLFYTSGTTGKPKGVMLSHANLSAMALQFHADMLAIDVDDVLVHVAPMSHGGGLYSIPYLMKGCLQVVSDSGGFDEAELATLLQFYQRASLFAAPTIVNRMVRHVLDHQITLPGLRCFLVGGAPFYAEDIKAAVRTFGERVAQMYGQGETPMTISAIRAQMLAQAVREDDNETLASVGYPQTSIDIRIESSEGTRAGPGELGEIVVYGPTVMHGYWRNETATQKTLVAGGLRTGDVGYIDERGLLHLKDRSKDVIISGGTNIYPREVEDALLAHRAVKEAAVIGLQDPEWGEAVTAVVVVAEPVSIAELDNVCTSAIARFKRPKHYVFVEELPKNPTGKVLKNELRRIAIAEVGKAST